jgi:hypothetical protein
MKAIPDEQRQIAAVIDMRMGENHGVDRVGRHRQRSPVAQPQVLDALKQPAIDEDA